MDKFQLQDAVTSEARFAMANRKTDERHSQPTS